MIDELQALIQLAWTIYNATKTMPEAKKGVEVALRKTKLVATILEEFSKKMQELQRDDPTVLPLLEEAKIDMERINDMVKKTTKMNDLIYLIKAKVIQAETELLMRHLNSTLSTLNTKLTIGLSMDLHHAMQDKDEENAIREEQDEKKRKLKETLKMKEGEEKTTSLRRLGHIKTQEELEETIAMMEEERRRTQELAGQKATEDKARAEANAEASMMEQIIAVLKLQESEQQAVPVNASIQHSSSSLVIPRCPISLMPMKDPVIVDSYEHCGHTFERDSIKKWMQDHKKMTCPKCNLLLRSYKLTPNADLRQVIEDATALDLLASPSFSSYSSTDSPNATPLPDISEQSLARSSNASEHGNNKAPIENVDKEDAIEDVDEELTTGHHESTVSKNTFWDQLKRHKVTLVAAFIVLLSSIIVFALVFGRRSKEGTPGLDEPKIEPSTLPPLAQTPAPTLWKTPPTTPAPTKLPTPPPTQFPVLPPPTPAPTKLLTPPPTLFPVSPPPTPTPTTPPTLPPTLFPVSPPPTPAPTTLPRCNWPDLRACSLSVDLSDEGLTGTIPTDIGHWTQLEALSLWGNHLLGTIPSEIGALTALTYLGLNENQLTGTIPSEIGALTALTWLGLDENQLTGTIPSEIRALTALTVLHLYANQLTGTIPSEIGALTALKRLGHDVNQLTGTIPSEIGALTALLLLYLSYNQLTGTIPSEIGALTALANLILYANQLTGTIPSEIGALTALPWLGLNQNHLTGTIPSEIGALTALTWLGLNENQLTGTIPSEIGALTVLTVLHLYVNQLTGTIPGEIGALTALNRMGYNVNQLTGTIPSEIRALTALQLLYLSDNQLMGTIPSEIGALTALANLVLHSNQLTGTIPSEIGALTALLKLVLYSNQLTGIVPTALCFLSFQRLAIDCDELECTSTCGCQDFDGEKYFDCPVT